VGIAEETGRPVRSVVPWLIVGGAISVASLILATRGIHLSEVVDAIEAASPLPLVAGVLLIMASYPLLAVRWRGIAADLDPPPATTMLELVLIGSAVNNALPARLGEVARSVGLARTSRSPVLRAFGTVVVDRVADILFFAAAFAATVAFSPTPGWVRWVGLGGTVITVLLVVVIVGVVVVMARRPASALPPGRIMAQAINFADGLRCVRTPSAAIRALFWTAAAWGVWMVGAWCVGDAIGIRLSVSEMVFTTALLGLGSAVPSAPGFIGTYHWIAASALGLFAIGGADALAYAVLVHAAWFIPTTVIGSVLMVRWGLSFAELRRVSITKAGAPT
jgi:uncharacterized protein (TIRG00374 family)